MYEQNLSDAYPKIELLDSSHGRPIQSWPCGSLDSITIGRSSNQHICIPDTYVSRSHAEINRTEQGWEIVALGRHGIVVDGVSVEKAPLNREAIFRLGASGPLLKFIREPLFPTDVKDTLIPMDTMATTQIDVLELEDLELQERDAKVDEIVNSDFFRLIKEKADRIRVGK